ncbi:MAG: hypothetical protein QXN08_02795 [Nitrososphaerales archaeon]
MVFTANIPLPSKEGGKVAGFAGLAAFVLASFILLWVNLITLEESYANYSIEMESILKRIKLEAQTAKEAYALSAINKSLSTISVNVTNVGAKSLPVKSFTYCDVVVAFFDLNIGSYSSYWLPYGKPSDRGYWYVAAIYTGAVLGESINPFNLTKLTGHLDPGETMLIIAVVPQGSLVDVDSAVSVLFVSSSGVEVLEVG